MNWASEFVSPTAKVMGHPPRKFKGDGRLVAADARRRHALGPEAVVLFALAMARRVAAIKGAGQRARSSL